MGLVSGSSQEMASGISPTGARLATAAGRFATFHRWIGSAGALSQAARLLRSQVFTPYST